MFLSATSLHRTMLACATVMSLSACVYSSAEFKPSASDAAAHAAVAVAKNPADIIITDKNITDRPYHVLGTVRASGRALQIWSPDPKADDVNKALRAEAAKQGADAVINVTYQSERQGLASKGHMVAEGQAVVFTQSTK